MSWPASSLREIVNLLDDWAGRGIEIENRAVGTGSNGHEHEFSYLEGVARTDHRLPCLSLGIFGIVGHHEEVAPLKDEQVC